MSHMRFKSIEVDQFRQFRSAMAVHDLTAQLNIIAGNNEAGKSTLLQAIRAALFDRYKSTVGESYRPYGAEVSPKVRLVFELDDTEYQLTKVFSRRKDGQATLVASDGRKWDGPAAEDYVSELLGFSYAGKGASRPELQGLAGLLWVEQSKAYEPVALTDQSRQQVHAVFENEMRELLGGDRGESLHRRISALRGEYFDMRGKPRGEYRQLQESNAELQTKLRDKKLELDEYETKVDRLEQRQNELNAYKKDKILEKAESRVRQAKAADVRLAELRKRVQTGIDQLARINAECGMAKQAWDTRRKLISDLNEAIDAEKIAAQEVLDKEAEIAPLSKRLKQQQEDLSALKAQKRDKDTELQLANDVLALSNLVAEYEELDDRFKNAQAADGERRSCATERDTIRITGKVLENLRKIERDRDLTNERLKSAATRIQYQLERDVVVQLNDQALTGDSSVLLTQKSELRVAGVGRFEVIPGGQDLDTLRRTVEEQDRLLAQSLAAVGVDSVSSAEALVRRWDDLNSQVSQHAATLKALAPDGLPGLEDRLTSVNARIKALREKLGNNADRKFEIEDLDREAAVLQSQVSDAERDLENAERVVQGLRETYARVSAEKTSAERLSKARATELEQASDKAQDDQLYMTLRGMEQAAEEAVRNLDIAQQAMNAENPETVEIELERSSLALDEVRREIDRLERDVRDLKVELGALGQKGLSEEVYSFEADYALVTLQLENISRRARALDLLQRTLDAALQHAKEAVAQPVIDKLLPYLRQLIPGASPSVNEDLILTGIVRQGMSETFGDLSIGTREQLAVLVRLAYADLLHEAGVPVTVILDDALVNSDDDRRDRMKSILYQAAKRYQVLVLTCHGREYRDAGGKNVHLEESVRCSPNRDRVEQYVVEDVF